MEPRGQWLVAESMDGITLEWWPYREQARDTRATVVLDADVPLTVEQWGLLKRQFNNMGIVPRIA
jgi:adenylate kinase family enzyme